MANVLCVLYDDPVGGYPPAYARDGIPKIDSYYDGSSTPTPEAIDFTPGELLGSVSGELGLRGFLEERGHQLTVTSDKDGPDSVFERELPEAEIVISQPFWPAYLTAERIAKAPNLKLAVTAGIGSDHVDLQAAIDRGLTVAEVSYSNSISVSEHVVMMILALVRNYIPSHQIVLDGGWNIADAVSRSYDLEGMQVGTVGAGRIGSAVLRRLKPFEVGLHYTDRHRLPAEVEAELGVTYHDTPEELVAVCDVVTINAPLHPETEHLFDEEMIGRMKRGAYLVNTARGKICDRDAVARACESGQLAGYAGDVWFPQPAPRDHPWRTMPNHGMTPHTSGTSLSAQARYAAGVREILECWFDGKPIREEYLIVDAGQLAGRRRALVQRRRRDRRLRRGRALQGRLTPGPVGAAELLNVSDYERAAEERLDPAAFGYFAGGANDEWTLRENVAAFGRWVLRPRMLVDVSALTGGDDRARHRGQLPRARRADGVPGPRPSRRRDERWPAARRRPGRSCACRRSRRSGSRRSPKRLLTALAGSSSTGARTARRCRTSSTGPSPPAIARSSSRSTYRRSAAASATCERASRPRRRSATSPTTP